MISPRQQLLDDYALASRAFAETVERLRAAGPGTEEFIRTLDETGTAHRACERCRIQLNKLLAARPA